MRINKLLWTLSEATQLLAGSETLAALMRNSRVVSFDGPYRHPLDRFLNEFTDWVDDNINQLCVFDRDPTRQQVRILFEDKADLAKFLLTYSGFYQDD